MLFLGGKHVEKEVIEYLTMKGKNDTWLFLRLGIAIKKPLNDVLCANYRFMKLF